MTIFRTKVTWGVSIDVLGVDISTMLNKSLNNAEVTSQARNMQRCPEVIGSRINLSVKFNLDLYQWSMAFTRCQMKRREAIRVCAIDNFEEFVILIELLFSIT